MTISLNNMPLQVCVLCVCWLAVSTMAFPSPTADSTTDLPSLTTTSSTAIPSSSTTTDSAANDARHNVTNVPNQITKHNNTDPKTPAQTTETSHSTISGDTTTSPPSTTAGSSIPEVTHGASTTMPQKDIFAEETNWFLQFKKSSNKPAWKTNGVHSPSSTASSIPEGAHGASTTMPPKDIFKEETNWFLQLPQSNNKAADVKTDEIHPSTTTVSSEDTNSAKTTVPQGDSLSVETNNFIGDLKQRLKSKKDSQSNVAVGDKDDMETDEFIKELRHQLHMKDSEPEPFYAPYSLFHAKKQHKGEVPPVTTVAPKKYWWEILEEQKTTQTPHSTTGKDEFMEELRHQLHMKDSEPEPFYAPYSLFHDQKEHKSKVPTKTTVAPRAESEKNLWEVLEEHKTTQTPHSTTGKDAFMKTTMAPQVESEKNLWEVLEEHKTTQTPHSTTEKDKFMKELRHQLHMKDSEPEPFYAPYSLFHDQKQHKSKVPSTKTVAPSDEVDDLITILNNHRSDAPAVQMESEKNLLEIPDEHKTDSTPQIPVKETEDTNEIVSSTPANLEKTEDLEVGIAQNPQAQVSADTGRDPEHHVIKESTQQDHSGLFGDADMTVVAVVAASAAGLLIVLTAIIVAAFCCCNTEARARRKQKELATMNKEGNRWDPQVLRPSKESVDAFMFGPVIPSVSEMFSKSVLEFNADAFTPPQAKDAVVTLSEQAVSTSSPAS